MLRFFTIFSIFICSLSVAAEDLNTQSTLAKNIIGTSKGWTVLRANPNNKDVCYAIMYVENRQGNQKIEEERPYIMVHYFSKDRTRFSVYFGYQLETKSVPMSIDSIQYKLTPLDSYGITDSPAQDAEIINQMQMAQTVLVRGEGKNYSYSIDEYSVDGFTEAFGIMQAKCGFNNDNSSFDTMIPTKKNLKPFEKQ